MNKKYIKTLLVSVLIIATMAISFKGVTQIVMATKTGKSETVDTNYFVSSSLNSQSSTNHQEDYVKPKYKLIDGGEPTSLDITCEEAAEIGVQSLYSVFGLDMNDKVIEMRYIPEIDGFGAQWKGTFFVDSKKDSSESIVESYSFIVDSSSGEIYNVYHERVLGKEFDVSFDENLKQNPEEYEKLAKELAIKLGAIQGEVKTAEYENQGGSDREIYVSIRVTGKNDDQAILIFSRYDKELIQILYNTSVKEMDAFNNPE